MRFSDFLLNEDLEGQKKSRADFIIRTYSTKWNGLHGFDSLDDFVDKLGQVDPTKNGAYMPWMAKLVLSKPDVNRAEDLERTGEDLRLFEKFKPKLSVKDINQVKSFDDLYSLVKDYAERPKTKEEKDEERRDKKIEATKKDIIVVYDGKEGWIRVPTTKDAAKFLGQSTRWCTSAASNNMFDYYSKSDSLFVIYDKNTKKRAQLHIDSGQFADEADKNMGTDAVPDWAWDPIIKWYKKNNPQLSLKHLIVLNKYSKENLAKGTDHEDLMDLMKKFGV